jgi:hypothetical protein
MLTNAPTDSASSGITAATIVMAVATVVLVLVNILYTTLTWKSLEEAREASLRDRESRHLEKIKTDVIEPIILWTRTTISKMSKGMGGGPLRLFSGFAGEPWRIDAAIDDPFLAGRLVIVADANVADTQATLEDAAFGRISRYLFDHTKRDHFPDVLIQFECFLEDVKLLTAAFVRFAQECAAKIADPAILPTVKTGQEDSMSEWANTHLLAAECIQSFLCGCEPQISQPATLPEYPRLLTVNGKSVAKAQTDSREKLRLWADASVKKVRSQWSDSDLSVRTKKLSDRGSSMLQDIEKLRYTEGLGVDCELVSGPRKHWWQIFK